MLAVQSIVTLVTVLGLATGADTVFAARFEIPGNDPSFRSRVYAGATIGQSQLDPETRGTRFASGGSGASATQIRLGIDVHNMLAIELDTSVLGSAGLSLDGETVAGDPNVKYSAASVSALVYGAQRRAATLASPGNQRVCAAGVRHRQACVERGTAGWQRYPAHPGSGR